jgi:hypothetical protein
MPRAVHRLVELSEQDRQLMAALGATKALLEDLPTTKQRGASLATPGLVIHIATSTQPPQIELAASPALPSDAAPED